jgi:hypothetical protein
MPLLRPKPVDPRQLLMLEQKRIEHQNLNLWRCWKFFALLVWRSLHCGPSWRLLTQSLQSPPLLLSLNNLIPPDPVALQL